LAIRRCCRPHRRARASFLHPGAEDLQTVQESVPWRVILAEQAAKAICSPASLPSAIRARRRGLADTDIRYAIYKDSSLAAPTHQRQCD